MIYDNFQVDYFYQNKKKRERNFCPIKFKNYRIIVSLKKIYLLFTRSMLFIYRTTTELELNLYLSSKFFKPSLIQVKKNILTNFNRENYVQ